MEIVVKIKKKHLKALYLAADRWEMGSVARHNLDNDGVPIYDALETVFRMLNDAGELD